MAYGDLLVLDLPTVSVTPSVQAYTQWNEALQDLADVVSAKVLPSNITWNADLNLKPAATAYGVTGAQRVQFDALAGLLSAATYPATLYSFGGNLYYNDASSNQIQITTGGAVAAAAGNVTGASYGTGGKEVNWDDANATYRMRSGSTTDAYASVSMNDALLNDGSGNFLRIGAPAMAGDYTMTLPAAVPATSNSVLAMATSGAVTATANPTVTTLTTTGIVTAGGAITSSSTVTATNFILSGGVPSKTLWIPGCAFQTNAEGLTTSIGTAGFTTSGVASLYAPIGLLVGHVITAVTFWVTNASGAPHTYTLESYNTVTGVSAVLATVSDSTSGYHGSALAGLPDTMFDDIAYVLRATRIAADVLHAVEIVYT